MKKPKFSFVILHYMDLSVTRMCIDSIYENVENEDIFIVIVDNGSPNCTGIELMNYYCKYINIKVILNETNDGFSRGNNIGIRYAREVIKSDFVIVLNNDTELIDKFFLKVIEEEYEYSKFAVLGPQVLDLSGGKNSNPLQGNHPLTIDEAVKWYKMWRRLYIKKLMFLGEKNKKNKDIINNNDLRIEDVVLHGCCLIFSQIFFEKHDGFAEFSFMYLEEPALYHMVKKENMLMVYNPKLKIYHKEGIATNLNTKNSLVKIKRMMKASKGLINYYKLGEKDENNKN